MPIPEMITVQEGSEWFVMGPWDHPCGPYRTKADAEEDRCGMARTYRYCDEPGFVTTEGATK